MSPSSKLVRAEKNLTSAFQLTPSPIEITLTLHTYIIKTNTFSIPIKLKTFLKTKMGSCLPNMGEKQLYRYIQRAQAFTKAGFIPYG